MRVVLSRKNGVGLWEKRELRMRQRERQGVGMCTWLHKQGEVMVRLLKLLRINSARLLHCSRGQVHASAQSRDYRTRQRTSSAFVQSQPWGERSPAASFTGTLQMSECASPLGSVERGQMGWDKKPCLASLPTAQLLLSSSYSTELGFKGLQYTQMYPLSLTELQLVSRHTSDQLVNISPAHDIWLQCPPYWN